MRVQQAIYNEFTKKGCMVLSVAHRLVNICDFDYILVLSQGHLAEAGHPHDLLCKYLPPLPPPPPSGTVEELPSVVPEEELAAIPIASFCSLVMQTGPEMSTKLRRMAQNAKLDKQK